MATLSPDYLAAANPQDVDTVLDLVATLTPAERRELVKAMRLEWCLGCGRAISCDNAPKCRSCDPELWTHE